MARMPRALLDPIIKEWTKFTLLNLTIYTDTCLTCIAHKPQIYTVKSVLWFFSSGKFLYWVYPEEIAGVVNGDCNHIA